MSGHLYPQDYVRILMLKIICNLVSNTRANTATATKVFSVPVSPAQQTVNQMSLTDKKKSCITRFRKSIDTNILKPDIKDEFTDGNKSVQRKTVSSPNNSNDRFRGHQSRIKN